MREADHSMSSSAELKNIENYISTFPHMFTANKIRTEETSLSHIVCHDFNNNNPSLGIFTEIRSNVPTLDAKL